MFLSAAPSPDSRETHRTAHTSSPWEQDPTLPPLLHGIVAEAAAAGVGARLVVATPGDRPRVLIGVRGGRLPWRAPALAAIERGDIFSYDSGVAAPVDGPPDARGALLLYHGPALSPRTAAQLARAHAARIEQALSHAAARLAATDAAVDALHHALAAHDERTARHAVAVRRLTRAVGLDMGVAAHTLREWEWAALLHDVGKLGIAPPLLRKPGPLDDAEWAMMRLHPSDGERIVRAVPALHGVAPAVRHHHERWDGGGYPDRLSGRAIPLAARVIALTDAYETMRAGRPYRAPLTCEETRGELRRAAGRQFNPGLLAWLPALTRHEIDI